MKFLLKNFLFVHILFCSVYIIWYSRFSPVSKFRKMHEKSSVKDANVSVPKPSIRIQNKYWQQWKTTTNSLFYLYSAFYDNRTTVTNSPVIRIVAMKNHYEETASPYSCKIFFDEGSIITKPVSRLERLNNHNRKSPKVQAHLITCVLGRKYRYQIPKSVSIIDNEQVHNRLDIQYYPPPPSVGKEDFALCLKGLYFPDKDISSYFVQWFELLFLMGVHKVFVYVYDVHPNILKVLKYYESKNKIHITPITLPIELKKNKVYNFLTQDNAIKLHTEHIPYNDCFYKNMNFYKYIAIFDYDEIIIPKHDYRWIGMINRSRSLETSLNETSSGYSFGRYLSMESMQFKKHNLVNRKQEMKILYNTRSKIVKGVKTILKTDRVEGVSIHEPSICTGSKCHPFYMNENIGFTVHYRSNCKEDQEILCSKKTISSDIPIFRYKNVLLRNIGKTLNYVKEQGLTFEKGSRNKTVDMFIGE